MHTILPKSGLLTMAGLVLLGLQVRAADDPLPSWNEGPSKKAVLDFVVRVTKEGSPDFVPVADRIAVFDNDGTLWCEQPVYVQAVFVPMPVSQSVARQMNSASNRQFEAYLLGFAKRHPNFRIVTPLMVAWPDEAFVDGIHMEESYVVRFTERFRICQNAAQAQTGPIVSCDLSWASVSGSGVARP